MGCLPDTAEPLKGPRWSKAVRRCLNVKGPVICGVDASSVAVGATEVARELAQRYQLPLLYAHVVQRGEGDDTAYELMHEVAAPENAEVAIESGHPADRLVALALERQASFLVVGNHGPRSSLLGSISADVSRRASCPVVVVPAAAGFADRHDAASGLEVNGGIVRFSLGHATRRAA
jgi:nucleotide-binding universal stress UspA family protein